MSDIDDSKPDDSKPASKKRPGNLKHGLRSNRILVNSRMPEEFRTISRITARFKRALEEAVKAEYGEISVDKTVLINSAVRNENLAHLAARWLRESQNLTLAEKMQLTLKISTATQARDRAVEKLDIAHTQKGMARRLLMGLSEDEPERDDGPDSDN